MVMGTCSDMDFFNRCGNYNTYFYLGGKVRAMYSEQCKSCIVEGCPDSCSVKINYKSELIKVVRCKDCAKREYCRTTNVWATVPDDDWFCADAERRSDE